MPTVFQLTLHAFALFSLLGLFLPSKAAAFWVGRTTDEQALLDAIQADPDEDTPRLRRLAG